MSPIALLLIGMLIVVLSILFLRLHAFLALILGSLVVAILTSQESVHQYAVRSEAVRVVAVDPNSNLIGLKATKNQKILSGYVAILSEDESSGKLDKYSDGIVSILSEEELNPIQRRNHNEFSYVYAELSCDSFPKSMTELFIAVS